MNNLQTDNHFAIIAIGCRFPGNADTPEQFWTLLRDGTDAITEIPAERFNAAEVFDADPTRPGTLYSRWGGFVRHLDEFDAEFFGISPREAVRIDPQQRLLLEVVWEALEDGGLRADQLAGSRTGVFIGISTHDYHDIQINPANRRRLDAHAATGTATSIAANRISFAYDLRGPSIAIDSACSSSLTAIHVACHSLKNGECDLAIAGGVNAFLTPELAIGYCRASMLSPDGRCKAFDAGANGFVRGEGAGVVILKSLAAALADGDNIYAVVRGTAINQDGRTSGLMVPSMEAQESLIREALRNARVEPHDLQYIEAHGTGTRVGDPIEATAIARALVNGRSGANPILVGSVKTNIGHLEAGAGIAGVIKTALALKHQQIPPSLHFKTPNPEIRLEASGLRVVTALEPWPRNGRAAIAGVNSFGFGGANAHVVLEEPPRSPPAIPGTDSERVRVLPVSARHPAALRQLAQSYRDLLATDSASSLRDLCYSASVRRSHHSCRAAFVGATRAELIDQIDTFLSDDDTQLESIDRRATGRGAKLAFVFTGMGPQWWAMGRQLLSEERVFRDAVEECDRLFHNIGTWGLLDALLADEATSRADEPDLASVTNLAVQVGLVRLWNSWGIVPDAIVGHSAGEIGAAWAGGALSLKDALSVAFHRGRLQNRTAGTGTMLAIGASADEAAAAIEKFADRVDIAAVNSPTSVTLSGPRAALEQIGLELTQEGRFNRFLRVDVPFHTRVMDEVREELLDSLASIEPTTPEIPFASTVSGDWMNDRLLDRHYWFENLRRPVRFADAIDRLHHEGFELFLEIGPHPALAGALSECLAAKSKSALILPSIRRKEDERRIMLRSLGALYARGRSVDWPVVSGRGALVPLPRYPWQRERHWFEAEPGGNDRPHGTDSGHPLLGYRLRSVLPSWESDLGHGRLEYLEDHIVQGTPVFPAAAYVEMALAAAKAIAQDKPAVIEQIEFRRVLSLTQRGDTLLQLQYVPATSSFEIHSSTNSGSAEWTLHAGGRIRSAPETSSETADLATIRTRCASSRPVDELYDALVARGLEYRGAFRGIAALWCGTGEALARITLRAGTVDSYRAHPALLDSAFQSMLVAAESRPDNGVSSGLCLPVAIRRATFLCEPGPDFWCHATITRMDRSGLEGDITIVREDGTVALRVEGLRCRALEDRAAAQRRELDELLYQVDWELKPLETRTARDAVPLRTADELGALMLPLAAQLDVNLGFTSHLKRAYPKVDAIAVHFARAALISLGWDPQTPLPHDAQLLAEQFGIAPPHRRFFNQLLRTVRAFPKLAAGETAQSERAEAERLCQQVLEKEADCDAIIDLLLRCGERLGSILNGRLDPREVLFAPEAITSWARFFATTPVCQYFNVLAADAIALALEHVERDTPLRVLEIGAGSAGTTLAILDRLADRKLEYWFTDVSTFFLTQARAQFAGRPGIDIKSLDIESDPVAQLGPESFDVVIAANVVHATADVRTSLMHIRELLCPGGLLAMVEVCRQMPWADQIFGVTDGWWRFTDVELRPDYALLSPERWQQALVETGFEKTAGVTEPCEPGDARQTVLLATRPRGEARLERRARPARDWLIFLDSSGVGDRIAASLREHGDRCVCVGPPDEESALTRVQLTLAGTEAVSNVVRDLSAQDFRFDGLIHANSLDTPRSDALTGAQMVDAAIACTESVLTITRAFEHAGRSLPPLWLLTSNTQPVLSEKDSENLAQAPLWGFARVVSNELSDVRCRLIDLGTAGDDELRALLDELDTEELEEEIALRGSQRFVARFRQKRSDDLRRTLPRRQLSPDAAFRVDIDTPGALDTLTLREAAMAKLGPGEIRIRVMAAGLNFRDVMLSLGMLPPMAIPGHDNRTVLGFECAGIVVDCGEGVTQFRPGDEVAAVAIGALASHVITRAAMVVRKPAHLTFEEAATIPLVFVTAHYALNHVARLAPGERVLIHAGTGGVGLAAIQLARRAGAQIFATAGNPEKRAFLHALGIEHVMDSRSLNFADEVLSLTGGEGVDVVLNSLAGEAITRGLAILRPYGRFLELGKRDIHADNTIGLLPFDRNLSFSSVALDRMCLDRPEYVGSMLAEIMTLVADRQLAPIPHTAFDLSETEQAIRFLAQAKHIGKLVVTVREPEYSVAQLVPDGPLCRAGATYVITGGLGGFGLAIGQWMVDQGARHIVLMSRSGVPAAESRAALRKLEESEARIVIFQGDAGDENDVRRMLDEIRRTMPPLRGIVHGAMVLDDAMLAQLTPERLRSVLWPKVGGAWNLHRLTETDELDFFVMFSSVASLLGMRGQANYAAANLFLDALAPYRRARGLPALTVNWGALSDVGYVARHQEVMEHLQRQGLQSVTPPEALYQLEQALRLRMSQITVLRFDWARWSTIDPAATLIRKSTKRLAHLVTDTAASPGESRTEGGSLLKEVTAAAPEARPALLTNLVADRVARVLGTSARKIDPGARLTDMGIDSLMAVELQTIFKRDFAVALPLTALLEGSTVTQLATRLLEQLATDAMPSSNGAPSSNGTATPSTEPDAAEMPSSPATAVPPAALRDGAIDGDNGGGATGGVARNLTVTHEAGDQQTGLPSVNGHDTSGVIEHRPAPASRRIDYGSIDYSRWTLTQTLAQRTLSLFFRLTARVEVTGLDRLPATGPALLAVNHLSMADTLLVMTLLSRRAICLAAERLRKLPLVRWFLDLGDSIYVRRGEADQEAIRCGLTVLKSGGILGLAPEGTRSRSGGLTRGHTGVAYIAAEAQVPIIPVAACGQEQILRNLKRLRRTRVQVHFGAPIRVEPGERTAARMQRETDRVMYAIAAMLPPEYRGVYRDAVDNGSLVTAVPEHEGAYGH
jgi:1-acyl-sn-glycerol-3-phosphate acyltransferase